MALVKIGNSQRPGVRPEYKTNVLIHKAANALGKPGIRKSDVFGDASSAKVFAYSVNPKDTSTIIRESSDGTRVFGRMVAGKFRAKKV